MPVFRISFTNGFRGSKSAGENGMTSIALLTDSVTLLILSLSDIRSPLNASETKAISISLKLLKFPAAFHCCFVQQKRLLKVFPMTDGRHISTSHITPNQIYFVRIQGHAKHYRASSWICSSFVISRRILC
jgi:hypothetical protein